MSQLLLLWNPPIRARGGGGVEQDEARGWEKDTSTRTLHYNVLKAVSKQSVVLSGGVWKHFSQMAVNPQKWPGIFQREQNVQNHRHEIILEMMWGSEQTQRSREQRETNPISLNAKWEAK